MTVYPRICAQKTMKRAITICYSVSALASIINYSVLDMENKQRFVKIKNYFENKGWQTNEQRNTWALHITQSSTFHSVDGWNI